MQDLVQIRGMGVETRGFRILTPTDMSHGGVCSQLSGRSPGVVRGSDLGEALEGTDSKADGGLLDALGCSHHTCTMIITSSQHMFTP